MLTQGPAWSEAVYRVGILGKNIPVGRAASVKSDFEARRV